MKALLADDSLRRVWGIGGVAGLMRWLDQLVVGVYVFDVTHSPLLVALVTLARLMPMLAGAFVGAFVERLALRRVLTYGLAAIAGVYAVLTILAFTGQLQIWQVGLGALLIGLYWSSAGVRRVRSGRIVMSPGAIANCQGCVLWPFAASVA
jgi:hypothetical protein